MDCDELINCEGLETRQTAILVTSMICYKVFYETMDWKC
jgi:hypothetical protein